MSIEKRRTELVRAVLVELFANGLQRVRPGNVNAVLRERNMPMGAWEVRAEFSHLESEGALVLDEPTGDWLQGDLTSTVSQQASS